ncbi:MAG: EAL domain-containing protein [Betaproteobacteria bacterium]|nr:EAL domain-containing protein [Betaproteobacteria bacterium]
MRRILRFLLQFAVAAAAVAVAHALPAPREIRVVTDDNYPPFVFRGADGELRGYEVAVWKLWQRKTGIPVEFSAEHWADAQRDVLAGRADVIDMIFRTPQREPYYDFSKPYATLPVSIYVDQGIHGIDSPRALRGFQVGVEQGDACVSHLRALGVDSLRLFPDYASLLRAARAGEVKMFCMDNDPADYYLYLYRSQLRYSKAFTLYRDQFRWAVRKGDAAMLRTVSDGMARITPQERAALADKWLRKPLDFADYARWLYAGLGGLLALGALVALWVRSLRAAVRAKTAELSRQVRLLELERARLHSLVETNPDGMWLKDLDGVYLHCNEPALRYIGKTREQVLGQRDGDFLPEDIAAHTVAGDREALRSGCEVRSEATLPNPDGGDFALEVLKIPVPAPGGGYLGVLGVARDISERRRMESTIRLWAEAFRNAGFGLSISDARSNRYLDVNAAFAQQRGYTREELTGQPVTSVIPAEILPRYLANRARGDEQAHAVYESLALRKDGSRFPVLLDVTVMFDDDGRAERRIVYSLDISERLRSENERRLWAHTFEHAGFGVAVSDVHSDLIVAANRAYARQRGYAVDELIGMPLERLYPADRLGQAREMRERAAQQGHCVFESEHLTRSGQRIPVSLDMTLVHDDEGQVRYRVVYSQDITARRQAERELRIAAAAFESQEGIVVTDTRGSIQRVNSAFSRITGWSAAEAIGRHPAMLRPEQRRPGLGAGPLRGLARNGYWSGETWSRRKDGEAFLARVAISAVRDEAGTVQHYVGTMTDITEEREARRQAERLARHDPLTDLPNRQYLRELAGAALAQARKSGELGALMMLDVDHFALINAAHGHRHGDLVLVELARRLRLALRPGDALGRFTGDKFVVLMEGIGGEWMHATHRAGAAAAQMREAAGAPFEWPDKRIPGVGLSIGLSLFGPETGARLDSDALLAQAEAAMYRAQEAGRNITRVFEPSMQAELDARGRLVEDLRAGISQGQLLLHLQPQVNGEGQVLAAEALVRWQHPTRGLLQPGSFIGVAEETGLIDALGREVLRMACAQIAAWSHEPATRELSLSVNLSALQFRREDFVAEILDTVAASGIDPRCLKLELTESMVMDDLDDAVHKLGRLRSHGLRIALDDFGTGSSSLSYLTRLPLDQLKIDKAFVRNLPDSRSDALVAQTIIAMARGLGLEIVAEGVETDAQLRFLRDHGCELYQGYLLGRPVPIEQFMRSAALQVD